MKIGIVGAGTVGGALGRGWSRAGHDVRFGVRDTGAAELRELLKEIGGGATAVSVQDAARFGDIVVLAVPWAAAGDALAAAGDLDGKVLLDCTNPLRAYLSGLTTEGGLSAAERIAGWAPGARVVKVFNTTGANNMLDPRYPEGAVTMLYCGDDAGAKDVAARLAADLGFEPLDAGGLERADLLEHFAMLWISLAVGGYGREIAFRLMRR